MLIEMLKVIVQIVARDGAYVTLRLRSGEMRKVEADCRATLGEVGNAEHMLRVLGKEMCIRDSIKVYALNEDLIARGLTGQISNDIILIDYTDFVRLTVKHSSQMAW